MLDLSERNLNRTIVTLAWPAILENLLQTSVFIVDSIFIGRLGTQAFAAVGQSSMVLFTVIFAFYGVGVAAAAIVARNLGRKNPDAASVAGAQGLLLGAAIGMGLAGLGLTFGEWALSALGTEPAVIAAAKGYMDIVFAFSFVRMILYIGSGLLRAAGDTRTPMWSTGIMNAFNIVGDWVLIFGVGPFPRMGINGAALATGLAYVVGATLILFKLFRPQNDFYIYGRDMLRVRFALIKTILRVALPNVGEQILLQGAYWTFLWIVTSLGTVALAAHFMAIRIEMLSFMPVFGLSTAVSTLVGQSLGAEKPELAEQTVSKSVHIGVFVMIGLGIMFVVAPGFFVSWFSPSPAVFPLASVCVQIAALELPTTAILMMYTGAMRGAGDTLSPMLISFFGALFLRVGVIYLLAIGLSLGLPGVWYGTALDWAIRSAIACVLFRRGRWKRIRL